MKQRGQMLLDRVLTVDLLEVALRIASSGEPCKDHGRLLTVALRDMVSAQEAQGKTKKCLTRVWINPPTRAVAMISWAAQHAELASDRRVLHLSALLATFPFVGTVVAIVGRALGLEGRVEAIDVRRRTRDIWGDKPSVDIAARKVYTTLKSLGVIASGTQQPLTLRGKLAVPPPLVPWVIHALLLTREAQAVLDNDLSGAPELFWAHLSGPDGRYPLLSRHKEGSRGVVWTER